jgi:protocatechuate 3,4-dioxygenase beta subunit
MSVRVPTAAIGFILALAGCTASTAQTGACVPTEADSMGPFYVAGTPVVDNLNRHGEPGEALLLSGRILSAADGTPPIAGARVEIWQTDGEAHYHPQANGHYADYADEEIDLRGTVITGQDGAYAVQTVVPGAYFPRPRHFHYRITAPGHAPLVTQLYVTGDGTLSQPGGACRHAPLETTPEGLRYQAPDIYLVAE